jgi:ubiquinone/menaquinone biosynthesis C-methylase UbiE
MNASFDAHADTYRDEVDRAIAFGGQGVDHYARRKADLLVALTSETLGPSSMSSILDVGCGIGLVDGHLVGAFGSVAGVDLSDAELARARAAHPEVSYLRSEAGRLPYADAHFDVVFAACVLHHVAPQEQASFVAEMFRVTRPGGLVVIFEHNPANPLTRLVVRRISFDAGVVLLRSRDVAELITNAGLKDPRVRNITFFPWDRDPFPRFEAALRRLPLGAQYIVFAQRPTL